MEVPSKILIVEDDPLLGEMLADILQRHGYAPLVASSGQEGLAYIASTGPVVVAMVDLKLPDLDGVSVLQALKQASPFTEVIILTGYASVDTAVASLKERAFDYLQKPVAPGVLLKTVERAVDRSARRQAEEVLRQRNQELARLWARLLEVQEEERKRLSQDLHDELGQILATCYMALNMAEEADDLLTAKAHLSQLKVLLDMADERVRHLSFALRPSLLDDLGLVPALQKLVEQTSAYSPIPVTLRAQELHHRPPPDIETVLYRVCQEALANIFRHTQARSATITLREEEEKVYLSIEDNGQGFRVEEALSARRETGGLGLTGMQERVRLVEGTLTIFSSLGQGTRIEVIIPCPRAESPERKSE
ncbi:MAG: response regulator [Deltaproteobacteria bacterium]|nr:response regulator [Deltaproteobacteria bacterium]